MTALEILKTYGKGETIASFYDDPDYGEEVQAAILELMPDFEYPDWSYRTFGEFVAAIEDHQRELDERLENARRFGYC